MPNTTTTSQLSINATAKKKKKKKKSNNRVRGKQEQLHKQVFIQPKATGFCVNAVV